MRKETIPFGEGELRVDRAEYRNEVIFESPNRTFSSVDAMLLWGHTLELDVILGKSSF